MLILLKSGETNTFYFLFNKKWNKIKCFHYKDLKK